MKTHDVKYVIENKRETHTYKNPVWVERNNFINHTVNAHFLKTHLNDIKKINLQSIPILFNSHLEHK
jgi:hypothetical protein